MKLNYSIFSAPGFKKCLGCILILLTLNSCKKAIDVGPQVGTVDAKNAFTSNGTAESVLAGIFDSMAGTGAFYNGQNSISLLMGLSADELVNYSNTPSYVQFFTNALSSQGATSGYFWPTIYQQIYNCNAAIAGLSSASNTQLTPAIKQQLLGEAKFSRAFIYFYAVNLYGDVPMPLTTDYVTNNTISRTPQAQVYQQIIQDLKDAQGLLSDGKYLSGTGTATTARLRPNKQAASALLARVYLYTKDWANAELNATAVIGTSLYVLEPNLNQVFLKATRESIWSLQPVSIGANNGDAYTLVLTASPTQSAAVQLPLNNIVVAAFEPGDARLTNWVGTFNAAATNTTPATTFYYAYKYKANTLSGSSAPVTEYPIVLRLAEQYLIRAEARAEQGNLGDAATDLNVIRARAGLPVTTATSQADLLTAIAHERQVELFTEWGHRWFDLRRTGQIDAVMGIVTPQKGGGAWNTNKQLVPIPSSEILINSHLTQNPGY
jgi:hypothetical protein